MSVLGYFSKRQPTTHGDKYYATRDDYDPVLRAHLHPKKTPESEATEYRSRYPDFSETA